VAGLCALLTDLTRRTTDKYIRTHLGSGLCGVYWAGLAKTWTSAPFNSAGFRSARSKLTRRRRAARGRTHADEVMQRLSEPVEPSDVWPSPPVTHSNALTRPAWSRMELEARSKKTRSTCACWSAACCGASCWLVVLREPAAEDPRSNG